MLKKKKKNIFFFFFFFFFFCKDGICAETTFNYNNRIIEISDKDVSRNNYNKYCKY